MPTPCALTPCHLPPATSQPTGVGAIAHGSGVHDARLDEHADGHWHFHFENEIIEDVGCFEADNVLSNINAGWIFRHIFFGNVNPALMAGSRKEALRVSRGVFTLSLA